MHGERLEQQMAFINELEKLKLVQRQNAVLGGVRRENSAEHSWHVALMALLLQEHAAKPALDALKLVKMLMLHDIVEIDAGDTWIYDAAGNADKAAREEAAAQRIFGLLPADQGAEMLALWREFEAGGSPEARFAAALDAMNPVVNYCVAGPAEDAPATLRSSQVVAKKRFIGDVAPALWQYTEQIIHDSAARGLYLSDFGD